MSELPLCFLPHPVLRKPAQPVTAFNQELRRLIEEMIATMYAHDGIGLAAPQVGRDVQVFVASPAQHRGRELVLVNPTLEQATGRASVVEGCLSLPDVWERVSRSADVRVRGQDAAGASVVVEGRGLLAIVLQHELDHLRGRLFIDRLSWLRRTRLRLQGRLGRASQAGEA